MNARHKKNSLIGLGIAMPLFAIAVTLMVTEVGPRPLAGILFLVAIPIYGWGCLELAHAKGRSTAVMFTLVFGLLPPLILLLILSDKRRKVRQ